MPVCQSHQIDMTIDVWKSGANFEKDIGAVYKANGWPFPAGGIRSHSIVSNRHINYDISKAGGFAPGFVIKHEIGHLLGLADIYEEAGYQSGIGVEYHPQSIMKGGTTTSYDDALGLVAVWTFLQKGVRNCDSKRKWSMKNSKGNGR
jgi:hypothetical protein